MNEINLEFILEDLTCVPKVYMQRNEKWYKIQQETGQTGKKITFYFNIQVKDFPCNIKIEDCNGTTIREYKNKTKYKEV